MSAVQDVDGRPLRDHLERIWEQTGVKPDQLEKAPRLPAELEPLWSIFMDLHARRGSTGLGSARIRFVDIDAWQRVTGSRLESWELSAIHAADQAYFDDLAKRQAKKPKR